MGGLVVWGAMGLGSWHVISDGWELGSMTSIGETGVCLSFEIPRWIGRPGLGT